MDIAEFRKKYPEYNDYTNAEVAQTLYNKYYQKYSREDFNRIFLGSPNPTEEFLAQKGIAQPPPSLLERIGRQAVKALPPAGAVLAEPFGLASAPVTGPVGPIAAPALGWGVGMEAQRLIEESMGWRKPIGPLEAMKEMVPEMAMQAAVGTPAAMLAGRGAKLALGPWAGSRKLEPLAAKMVEEGFPISPDVVRPGITTKAVMWIADHIQPGIVVGKRFRGRIIDMMMRARREFVEEVLEMPKPGTSREIFEEARGLYREVVKRAGGEEMMYSKEMIPNFTNWLKNADLSYIRAIDRKVADRLKDAKNSLGLAIGSKGDEIAFGKLNDILANVWRKWGKMKGNEKAVFGRLRDALIKDLTYIEEQTGRAVAKAQELASSTYKTAQKAAQADYIERLLDSATRYDEAREMYMFSPATFSNLLQNPKVWNKLETFFRNEPEKLRLIQQFARKMEVGAKDVARFKRRPDLLEQIASMGPYGAGAYVTKSPWVAVPAGFQGIMTYSLMNPKGWLRQWLTTGLPGKLALPLTKGAARYATEEYREEFLPEYLAR